MCRMCAEQVLEWDNMFENLVFDSIEAGNSKLLTGHKIESMNGNTLD